MRKSIVLVIVMLLHAFPVFSQQTAWQETYYNSYNHTNFATFEPFSTTINPESFDYKLLNAAIFFETNRQRALFGQKPLKHDSRLENCAQGHSNDMVNYNFYSHTSTVPGKYSLSDRTKKFGISETYIGENIHDNYILKNNGEAYYPPSQVGYFKSLSGQPIPMHSYLSMAKEIVKGWMNSPGHKENILYANYSHLGVGNAVHYTGSGIDRISWVKSTQNFAMLSEPAYISRKPSTSTYSQFSQSNTSNQYTTRNYSYSQPSVAKNTYQQSYANYENPSRLCVGVCVAGIGSKVNDLTTGIYHYQITGQLGGYVGVRDHKQNFWGVFPSVDLEKGIPFTLEAGTALLSFLRLSAGARLMHVDTLGKINKVICPSATIGVQIHMGFSFVSLDCNSFYQYGKASQRLIASTGIYF